MKRKLLVFHPIIAPYRIDFFNSLSKTFDSEISLYWRNLKDQTFNYKNIESQFLFSPVYIIKDEMGKLAWLRKIWNAISCSKSDIVMVSEFGLVTILTIIHKIITRSKYRIISIVDDSYNMVADNNHFSRKHKWAAHVLTPFIDNVVNVEPKVVNYYQKKYHKGIYMPIIVDDSRYRKRLERCLPVSESYVKKYGLDNKKVLLFVGRLVSIKNVSFAIKAFVKANVKDSVFVIVGDGPEIDNLKIIAQGQDNILFMGRLEGDELYAWYNIAQTFTLPSTQEPFGAVTNEALLGGCFALVSKLAGSNCLIDDYKNGRIIDPYDIDSFSKIIKQSLEQCNSVVIPLLLRPSRMIESFELCFERFVKQI